MSGTAVKTEKRERFTGLSYLRILATLAILCAHSWSTLTSNATYFKLGEFEQVSLEIGWNLTKWDIPVFFMITGTLFLNQNRIITYSQAINKYARRMFFALVLFGIPYISLYQLFDAKSFSLSMICEVLNKWINASDVGHLWYLYKIIGLYILMPFFKIFVNHSSQQEYITVLTLLFIFNFAFPLIDKLFLTQIAFKLPIDTYPIFYLLEGHYLYENREFWKTRLWIPIAGMMVLFPAIVVAVILRWPFELLLAYDSPVLAILAACIFILFSLIDKPLDDKIWNIDRLCFGVYLIHPLFIQAVFRFLKIVPTGNRLFLLNMVLFDLGFIVLSFTASLVMNHIKPIKKYIL